jgi:fructose/tagatose bisphosphate aldolase
LHGKRALDLERVARLAQTVSLPLVLHGGTSIDDDSLREAVKLGVAKVNYGTVIKLSYLEAVRRALQSTEANPHRLLGMGEHDDVLVIGRRAVRDTVLGRIAVLGCAGRAVDHG